MWDSSQGGHSQEGSSFSIFCLIPGGERSIRNYKLSQGWWHKLLIPELGRQNKENLFEFEASLISRESSRTGKTTQ